jgi:uncharacterized membrane protein HdeD (DUF308 family)
MMTNSVVLGAVAMASVVASMFFIRFWLDTKDRFFLFFAIAFGVDAITRTFLALGDLSKEHEPFFYLGRLLTFGLIILAIIDKNRSHQA